MLKEKLKNYRIILASGSPRRQQFLKDLDCNFIIDQRPVLEEYPGDLTGAGITDYLAQLKAEVFLPDLTSNDILITSDTIVWHIGGALGKPSSLAEAYKMLESLSGNTHEVITSVTFTTRGHQETVNCTTSVTFKDLSKEEIEYYVQNFHPLDKAGAYGIQEWIGMVGITRVEGSYFNVVGLPTHLVYETLLKIVSI